MDNVEHSGILLDDGNVICGCCGGLIEADNIGEFDDCDHVIKEIFDEWVNISKEIIGE